MAVGKENVNLMGNRHELTDRLFAERPPRLEGATKDNQMPDIIYTTRVTSNRKSSRVDPCRRRPVRA